ncbi:MAG TPA: phosphoribosyltransferase family protein [Bacteroidia bacterium]|nr:phosphoribosyltransferase family protein [Bacteroidia bacterium]
MEATKSLILNSHKITQKIERMAWEILENNFSETEVVLVGIQSNGYTLAKRIADRLQKISSLKVSLYAISINKKQPLDEPARFDIPLSELKGKAIIVVDDVLNSGKTLLYGIKPFLDIPVKRLQTAVLVDRKHNRYPVKSDFTGLSLATTLKEHISVELDKAGEEAVYLL